MTKEERAVKAAAYSEAHEEVDFSTFSVNTLKPLRREQDPKTQQKVISQLTQPSLSDSKRNDKKHRAKRRSLECIELNEPFEGSEGHHIDKEFVLHIPADLHHSIAHNVFTGYHMEEINELAINYAYGVEL